LRDKRGQHPVNELLFALKRARVFACPDDSEPSIFGQATEVSVYVPFGHLSKEMTDEIFILGYAHNVLLSVLLRESSAGTSSPSTPNACEVAQSKQATFAKVARYPKLELSPKNARFLRRLQGLR
jgi:hypothetical protein